MSDMEPLQLLLFRQLKKINKFTLLILILVFQEWMDIS